jgi:hypothetical protein
MWWYAALMAGSISPEQVRSQVEKFWQIMCGKSPEKLADLYASNALILTGKARKPEPVNVVLSRRARQISSPAAEAAAELGGIEVQLPEPGVAIASYTYAFHHKRPTETGGVLKRHTMFGRATQIFQANDREGLRIVHEHLSAAANPEVEKSATS